MGDAVSVSTTDQSVTSTDNSGVETALMTDIMGNKNRVESTDLSNNAGVVLDGSKVSGDFSVTTTDHGAIAGSLDFANQFGMSSLDFGRDALDKVSDASREALQVAAKSSQSSLDKVTSAQQVAGQGGSQKTIVFIIAGVLVVAGLAVYVTAGKN